MCHVLIIEDEPLVALMIQFLLEDEGATSFAFADSEAAAVEAAVETPPALITADVRLASGTGPAAVKAIHERLGSVPVIFITASPEACKPCKSWGITLSKPVDSAAVAKAFHVLRAQ